MDLTRAANRLENNTSKYIATGEIFTQCSGPTLSQGAKFWRHRSTPLNVKRKETRSEMASKMLTMVKQRPFLVGGVAAASLLYLVRLSCFPGRASVSLSRTES